MRDSVSPSFGRFIIIRYARSHGTVGWRERDLHGLQITDAIGLLSKNHMFLKIFSTVTGYVYDEKYNKVAISSYRPLETIFSMAARKRGTDL